MDPLTAGTVAAGVNFVGGLFSQASARSAYQHRYQDTVEDMRAAGLNPALAYGQNPGGGAQTADFGGVGSAGTAAAQAQANAAKTRAETQLLRRQSEDLVTQTRLRNYLLNADVNLRGEQLSNLNVDTSMKTILRDLQMATFDSNVQGTKAMNRLRQLSIPQQKAISEWFRKHPDLGGWLNSAGNISSLLRAITP